MARMSWWFSPNTILLEVVPRIQIEPCTILPRQELTPTISEDWDSYPPTPHPLPSTPSQVGQGQRLSGSPGMRSN